MDGEKSEGGKHIESEMDVSSLEKNERWGMELGNKHDNKFRIIFANCNGLPIFNQHSKNDQIRSCIDEWNADVLGLEEVNVCWQVINNSDRLYTRPSTWWKSRHIVTSNILGHKKEFQPGGVFSDQCGFWK